MMDFDYVMAFLKAKRDAPNYREATDKEMKARKTVAHAKHGIPKQGAASGMILPVRQTTFAMRG